MSAFDPILPSQREISYRNLSKSMYRKLLIRFFECRVSAFEVRPKEMIASRAGVVELGEDESFHFIVELNQEGRCIFSYNSNMNIFTRMLKTKEYHRGRGTDGGGNHNETHHLQNPHLWPSPGPWTPLSDQMKLFSLFLT